ncbi:MAG TPA: endonuclease/exonuclease/phosphatase family protein [Pyrinomonadaceae bacterium]|nr:endonuclease/exonuclease/phosphatase family protein [Pyrinomonadaceae bacterium]
MKSINFCIIFVLFLAITANGQTFKVMTYNIRLDLASDGENDWDHRKSFFISQIKFYEPDIFGVQEALPNQINDLTSNLSDYDKIGIGREGKDKGEASAIFFKKNRFKVSDETTFWLSETPEKVSKSWDAALPRICTFGLFKDLKTKKTFWVFNTHLDHIGEIARKKGVEMILAKMKEVNRKNYPVIFSGDLNAEPDSELLINLRKEMKDSREASRQKPFGPNGSFNGFKFNEPVTRLIDYIFVDNSNRIAINKYAVLSDSVNLHYPSDHLPVFVEAEFRKN